ncbi:hypothetical protein [Acinetobacter baumannii]|uniref:hypothetical protein n=1 Tax=Acinetobacter baumannii TaxID=470 RepID=UPI000DF1BF83|nr:hypothetical protein [Acinetobacter baumannii]RCT89677.1 hypothetical protein DVA68_15875 [Acinetobacter baumannii]
MNDITSILENYINEVVHLNAISTYTLLDYDQYSVKSKQLDPQNDPFRSMAPDELKDLRDWFYITTKHDILSIFWNEKIPRTVKELLFIAAKKKRGFVFWQNPIKVITDFLLSLESEQLFETKLREIIQIHNSKADKSYNMIELKRICDRYISDLVSSYITFKQKQSNPEYAKVIFGDIQIFTKDFLDNANSYLNKIKDEDLNEKWKHISYIFEDFIAINYSSVEKL